MTAEKKFCHSEVRPHVYSWCNTPSIEQTSGIEEPRISSAVGWYFVFLADADRAAILSHERLALSQLGASASMV